MTKPRLLVFASGSATGGGSGFENLVIEARAGVVNADIVAVVSNHAEGGVRERAERLRIPFIYFPAPWTTERYQEIVKDAGADFVALSGWLKKVGGLDPSTTINIHPGPVPEFGGAGLYGHHVHEAVMGAFHRGEITHSAVCMHFVTSEYDRGPVFFRCSVKILEDDTPDSLAARVNKIEHAWQPRITNLVVERKIRWSGRKEDRVIYPPDYRRAIYAVL